MQSKGQGKVRAGVTFPFIWNSEAAAGAAWAADEKSGYRLRVSRSMGAHFKNIPVRIFLGSSIPQTLQT